MTTFKKLKIDPVLRYQPSYEDADGNKLFITYSNGYSKDSGARKVFTHLEDTEGKELARHIFYDVGHFQEKEVLEYYDNYTIYACIRCGAPNASYGDEGSALCQTCYSVVADLQYERSKDNQSTF
jgi:hypothetical protein